MSDKSKLYYCCCYTTTLVFEKGEGLALLWSSYAGPCYCYVTGVPDPATALHPTEHGTSWGRGEPAVKRKLVYTSGAGVSVAQPVVPQPPPPMLFTRRAPRPYMLNTQSEKHKIHGILFIFSLFYEYASQP